MTPMFRSFLGLFAIYQFRVTIPPDA